MLEYLNIRGHQPLPLFVSFVSREMFVDYLSKALVHFNLDPSSHKGQF